ncbi:hypothetical protein ACIOK4_00345 [Streptomyces bottropensis]|uniref:hypothetical protein n=1 Tax=Streptomyces bottropensis TaxID=42235 RepID=UPI0038079837
MTTSSHPPFGFHPTGQAPAPMPLRHVPAMQDPAAPAASAPTAVALPQPVFPMCVLCGNRRDLVPRGQERYTFGARVLVCRTGCEISPVQAATGVITAAMTNGAGTPREWAQAEEDAGLLFDPQRAKDIAAAADEAARADMRAELNQAREDRHSLDWFHSRYLAVGELCAGRHSDHLLTVAEVLTAIDGKLTGGPLPITWEGVLVGPQGDGPGGDRTLLGCTTARGGVAVLALDDEQCTDLAAKLATVHPAEACATPGCGLADDQVDESDPTLWGWIRLDVAGSEQGPRWWCTPACATAAMTAAADQLAAITPARPTRPAPMVVEDDVAHCARCGCTEERACEGGCYWVANPQMLDLCSACASPQELAYGAFRPQGGQGATS